MKTCENCAYMVYDEDAETCTCNNYWSERLGELVLPIGRCQQWEHKDEVEGFKGEEEEDEVEGFKGEEEEDE